jgi:YtxH-like protein
MPTGPATTADDIAESIRALIDRVSDAKITQEMARRSQDVAAALADRGTEMGDLAAEAWRDSRPMRRDAAKRLGRATNDAAHWSDRTWRKSLRPALRDLWSRRGLAMGAAGAAVPAGRELVDTAAVRLGIRQREERHWGAFFLGLVIGAIGGAIVALMLTPKRGDEMRRELGARADEVKSELATRADEIVTRAKDAEWVPIFQRDEATNGQPDELPTEPITSEVTSTDPALTDPWATEPISTEPTTDAVQEAAADAGTATGAAAEEAADETAEAINEAYDTVDRESRT